MKSDQARRWRWTLLVFGCVVVAQLGLVAAIGTDVPFQDQWDVEGRWFYPALREGRLHFADFFRPHNEHRILWTHLLNYGLFVVNGGWDPLVQLVAGAVLRASAAAVLADGLIAAAMPPWRPVVAVGVAIAFLPQLAWHNAVWGFQSQVYFVLLFSVITLRCVAASPRPLPLAAALVTGAAAMLAMAPGAAVAVAVLALGAVHGLERRNLSTDDAARLGLALLLAATALLVRAPAPQHATLHSHDLGALIHAVAMVLAWPHVGQPLAAIVLNAPVIIAVATRITRRRTAAPGEDFALMLAVFAVTLAVAAGWARGASDEFAFGVPARYVDLLVLLPIANVWCAAALAGWAAAEGRSLARVGFAAWSVFLVVGWVGLSAEMTRGVVIPRARDRDAPVRLVRQFQMSHDPAVFEGQPRLLVPHPNPATVEAVLTDSRLQGALPPSLQPGARMGPLSRGARAVLFRREERQ